MSKEHTDMRRPLTAVAAAASTLCIGLTGAAPSHSDETPENGIDVQVPDSKDRIEDYWTRDRMRAAKPTPKPQISREAPVPAAPEDGDTDAD